MRVRKRELHELGSKTSCVFAAQTWLRFWLVRLWYDLTHHPGFVGRPRVNFGHFVCNFKLMLLTLWGPKPVLILIKCPIGEFRAKKCQALKRKYLSFLTAFPVSWKLFACLENSSALLRILQPNLLPKPNSRSSPAYTLCIRNWSWPRWTAHICMDGQIVCLKLPPNSWASRAALKLWFTLSCFGPYCCVHTNFFLIFFLRKFAPECTCVHGYCSAAQRASNLSTNTCNSLALDQDRNILFAWEP